MSTNAWWREVRARQFPAHIYAKQTHCGDCLRKYLRLYMRKWRLQAKPSRIDVPYPTAPTNQTRPSGQFHPRPSMQTHQARPNLIYPCRRTRPSLSDKPCHPSSTSRADPIRRSCPDQTFTTRRTDPFRSDEPCRAHPSQAISTSRTKSILNP